MQVDDVLASIADGFVAVDNEWRITFVNAAAERMWNRNAGELAGKAIFSSLNCDPNDPFQAGCVASKKDGEPVAFTAYSEISTGWLEARGYPHPGGYTIFFRDVSAERNSHRATLDKLRKLEAARSINQRIFETSLDLILVVSRRGDFIRVSPSSMAILGYHPDELVGRSAAEILYPEDLESTRAEMRLARRGGLMRNFECRYIRKDGRVVSLAWTGVWSEPEQQHFFIGRDMTERIVAEERLRRSQRLEAVGQLTGGIAHDFNNLLTVVIGNLDLLRDRLHADPQAADFAENALKASLRGAELTRQLLAFSRRQALDAKVIAINELVAAIMGLLRRTLGEQIEIATVLAPDLWPAFVDPAQLESALVNLAINARDAMSGGGRLTIETANKQLDERYAGENVDVVPGDYVMLAVSDTGTGMAPNVLARAFEPFFTTKPPGEGTGLGLSMVYGFARQSQGHIKIYSELEHGTTVRLYLPRATDGAAHAAEAKPTSLPVAKSGERILVVEDNPDVRMVVATQLGELGYRVIEATNAEAALNILERGEGVDLLFSDVVMPGSMGGGDLARAARALRPGLKVLLTSGFAKASMQSGPRAEEFKNLLSKPYRKADLAAKLRATLDAES
ncbi:MAG: PAS domain S-box protein [Proteobacteria bacterium]|nr:PAS domain S-box protein [Pseudomonadota bacterium]